MIDLEQYTFKAPCIHIVAPGQVHQLSRSGETIGTVVMFAGDLDLSLAENAKNMLFGPGNTSTKNISKDQLKAAIGIVGHIETELKNERAISINYLGILIMKCLEWIKDSKQKQGSLVRSDIVGRFRIMVEQHFKEQRQVGIFAQEMNITAGHLNELCKTRLGKSASEIIKERVLLEAKRSLLHSELSIKEIAYALNMQDPSYFTRMFKKGTGKGPQQFRDQIREKYK